MKRRAGAFPHAARLNRTVDRFTTSMIPKLSGSCANCAHVCGQRVILRRYVDTEVEAWFPLYVAEYPTVYHSWAFRSERRSRSNTLLHPLRTRVWCASFIT